MKKLFALLVLTVLFLCLTACSHEKDLSALEEYTSGELRVLMEDARKIADSRIPEEGSIILETFVDLMSENGYQLKTERVLDGCFELTDSNIPSFSMLFYYNNAWSGSIRSDITAEDARDCFSRLLKAIAHVEGHPKEEKKVEYYGYDLKKISPLETCFLTFTIKPS